MTKHPHLKQVLATLLTIVAVFAGQQAFATITSPMSLTGNSALMNGQYYHVWKTEGFLGNHSQPRTQGSSYTFNGQNIVLQGGAVRITGTLNFTQADDFTDVTTGSTVTVEFYSTNFWFFSAEVKKLDGTSVSGCSYSASSDHNSITVTIPSGKTFGNIYLSYSVHPQMTESNTTISGIEASYIYQGSAIRPQPTVVYTNPNLSQTTLTLNTDYTLSYTNNNGPGIATVIITGAGEYAGTLTRTYTIRNIDLNDFNSLGNNTYEIANKDDLDHLALLVDVAANNCQGLTFKQTADITYSHGSSTTENNFTQIGGYFGGDKNFSGTYDGQNHTISGIRVYKSPSTNSNENKNVALFGRISGATIQNVILTDARITGYRYVGGLVGNKASGTVQNCLVVGSTITCGNTYGGALFGSNNGTLTANHYRNCTVNNTTNATNVGVGNSSSSNDMAGARSVHPLTIQNANITATGESVAYQGTTYYASNTQITLGYNNLPAGYTLTYTLNGTALSGNTFTMPANDNATVTATAPLTPITYNITYDLDGGSVATANPATYNVTTPTFTLNNPTKAGYTFTGWTGSNGTTPQTEVTIAQGSTGNLNYTAHWSLDTYNITYDLDGGSVATANPATYNVTTPTFTLNNPTKAGYTFTGWTGSNGTTPQTEVTIAQGSTGDRSYTAHWTQYAFTLTLGTNITASGTVAFTLDGTDYYAPGTEITLAYSGNNPEGQHLVFYVNGTPIANNGNTFAMPAANATVSVAFCYWPGSGTENDPFIISTTTELDLLAYAVNSYFHFSSHKFFKLGADIAYDPNVLNANGTNYTTIGYTSSEYWFYGSFDGDGHTISGIRSSQGLFNRIGDSGIVKNVTLADAVVNGNDSRGGIASINIGHIENCRVINTVINGNNFVGGIAGWMEEGQIENCQVINTVCNGSATVGGIAGWLDFGQIESCQVINTDINGAQYLGGIAGASSSNTTLENCLALDTDITATQQPNPYSGAIEGGTSKTTLLTSNYYHGCSMNNETSGIGTENGDITENDGAMQVFSLSLGGNVTATPAPVVTYNGTDYYFAGTTITLVYGGTIPSGCSLVYSVNGNAIEGNSFEMPTQDVAVTLTKQGLRYTYNSSTGALALIWGDFNKNNKWGSEVTATAVTSVTATNDVSFTGSCYNLFYNFTNCTSMELGNVNTDALNNMSCMFWGCSSLTTLDLSGWNTANVTNMSYMFIRSTSLQSLNLSGWNTANVTDMSNMFRECSGLQSLDLSGWNTANVTDMSWMFQQCSSLQSLSLSGWNTANVTDMTWMFQQCSSLQSLSLSGWNTANVTNMYQMFQQCSSLQSLSLTGWNTANVTQMSSMFQQCSSLQSLSLSGWNTSNVENMSYMFNGCSGLQSLDLTGWNTSNVEDMSYMFDGCSSLQSLDLTGWNTANVTNMSGMFYGCSSLTTIYAGEGWNTYNVWDMSYMFEDCTSLVGGMGTTYDAYHTDGEYARIDGGPDNPGYLSRLRYTFNSTTGELALLWGEFNKDNKWGSEVTSSAVTRVTATDEVSFTGDCSELFSNFTNCTSMDLGNVNTDALNNTFRMFDKCLSLLSLEGISDWDVSNVTNMIAMFRDCWSLSSLDLSDWNTANVTNMSSMFAGSGSLTTIYVGTSWNTESVTSTSYMFLDCSSLQSLDLSGWNTANVTDMSYMFRGCSGLQSLNVSGWNTANVTDMSYMFNDCSGLQSLNVSGWNTANVTDMSGMFDGCSGLQSLDLSGWSTANVTDMSGMFYSCSGLQSLDLSGWSTANVFDMSHMFQNCTNLATIYVGEGWSTSWVIRSNYMFSGCTSLVGGMGTHYISIHNDKAYARIDGGPHNPGYFTAPFTKEIAGYEDNESGWYLIASPLATDIAPTAVTNMTNETFDLYYFDQTGGNNGKEWKNWKNEGGDGYHFNLEAGKGYLYANSGDVTLMFAGTPYDGDGVVNLTYSTDNPNATMHGWNLIGNPFSTNATIGDTPFYRMNAAGSEIIAADVNDNTVNPMEGIFVKATQANQTVTFETAMTRGNANSNSAALVMDISQNRGGVIDRAIVRFDEGQTLPKFQIHENSTKVYIPQDGTDYAVAVIASDSEAIQPTEHPIHFKAAENGTYTISVNVDNLEMGYLHLIDNLTGADVDLLQTPEYTFTAKTTDYASRFKLMFSINQEDGPSTGSGTFAFISNGNIIVNGEGTLQVIDMMGRVILSGDTINRVSTGGMTAGVYVLRLINGDNVKTQKIVVK